MDPLQQNATNPVAANSVHGKQHSLSIGLFGIGLDTYWPQFEGLKERLTGYLHIVEQRLQKPGARIVNLGIIDHVQQATQAGHQFRQADVDIVFIYATTYAVSATVLPVVRRLGVPVIILNLSPGPALDYSRIASLNNRTQMTGEWLAFCGGCPVPEIMNVFRRAGIAVQQVTGMLLDDPVAWGQIDEWIEACRVACIMSHNNLGLMGNYYNGMLDIYSDPTLQLITFGGNMTILEVDELSALKETVSEEAIQARVEEFDERFEVQTDCPPLELKRAARTSVALDRLAEKHDLGSMAYYHKGTGNTSNEDTMSSIILGTSLLTARGIPVAGEYEIKNVQAMKIMDSFGVGGSFTEYYAIDYIDDVVLMGHDGPGHIQIAQGKTKVRPLNVYHGKVGAGLSVEMSVRNGPVTMLSVVETSAGKLMLLLAEGESVKGPILEIGNTNSRYRFAPGAREFVERWNRHGPAHHCAVGVGHIGSKLRKLGEILKIDVVQVC